MNRSAALRLRDLRAIHALAGEGRELGDDAGGWLAHFYAGLGRLVGAPLVVGGEAAVTPAGVFPTATVEWGWDNGFDRAVFDQVVLSGPPPDLTENLQFAAYFARPDPADGAALTRKDLVPDRDWYASRYFRTFHDHTRIGHVLLAFVPMPGRPGLCSGITLSRPVAESRDFGPRERTVAREAHAVIAAQIGGPLARFGEPSPQHLPPRARQVLRCVLEGDSDKQVAARLGLSRHTVNQYAKAIFRHFGVGTRAELLARWVKRGWGGTFAWADPLDD